MDASNRPEAVVTVDVIAAKGLLGQGRRYLDVRTNEEFNKGHIGNALNVPYMFKTKKGCNSGGRSLRACVDLLNAGFKHVTNMGGGYSAWVDNEHGGNKSADEFETSCKFRP
ncbi:rhodanese/cell cycle control phosphatase superfamily protein [Actinidia rufa]|uniref:Rhodanese/cell cycle control phosphatase superfamily protein n=1 Tax=Actinidia rufa TaxID=165716 RepID=A0A7J0EQ97_9ERIC|nr:rhodanese/cell cycle control phosphatase superfamily protein [Actinidia rufa]